MHCGVFHLINIFRWLMEPLLFPRARRDSWLQVFHGSAFVHFCSLHRNIDSFLHVVLSPFQKRCTRFPSIAFTIALISYLAGRRKKKKVRMETLYIFLPAAQLRRSISGAFHLHLHLLLLPCSKICTRRSKTT